MQAYNKIMLKPVTSTGFVCLYDTRVLYPTSDAEPSPPPFALHRGRRGGVHRRGDAEQAAGAAQGRARG